MTDSFFHEYEDPHHWDNRTAQWINMPFFVNRYLDWRDYKIRKFLKQQKGLVLDDGCGEGRLLAYADVGVDFSKGMVDRAKTVGKPVLRASALALPFRTQTFTLAYMSYVMLHISPENRLQAKAEAWRVAKAFIDFDETVWRTTTSFVQIHEKLQALRLPKTVKIPIAFLISFPISLIAQLRQFRKQHGDLFAFIGLLLMLLSLLLMAWE